MKTVKVSNKVYSKDFSIKSLGYDCREVDSFLDEINEEVVKLEREIASLQEKMRQLEGKNSVLDQQYRNVSLELYNTKAQNGVASTSSANFSNMELFNRISNLEKMVKKLLDKENG